MITFGNTVWIQDYRREMPEQTPVKIRHHRRPPPSLLSQANNYTDLSESRLIVPTCKPCTANGVCQKDIYLWTHPGFICVSELMRRSRISQTIIFDIYMRWKVHIWYNAKKAFRSVSLVMCVDNVGPYTRSSTTAKAPHWATHK